jgi:hypothetical protein
MWTVPSIIAVIGGIALLAGLFGGLEAQQLKVAPLPRSLRFVSGFIGIALVGVAVWLSLSSAPPPPSGATTSTPAPPAVPTTAPLSSTAIPIPTTPTQIIAPSPVTQATPTLIRTLSSADEVATAIAPLTKQAQQVYGPNDGQVDDHENHVNVAGSNVNLRDFIAEARFSYPSDPSQGAWAYGFVFRWINWDTPHYRLFVDSSGEWILQRIEFSNGQPQFQNAASGHVKDLNVAANGVNTLRLIVNDKTAWFYVNGEYIATLDVSSVLNTGDVLVGNGFNTPAINGRKMSYKNFKVYSLEQ